MINRLLHVTQVIYGNVLKINLLWKMESKGEKSASEEGDLCKVNYTTFIKGQSWDSIFFMI